MKTHHTISVVLLLLSFALPCTSPARPVVGEASVTIFGQVPKEIAEKARADAAVAFREELQMWLREEMRIDIDTVNTVKKFALKKLADRCLEAAEAKTVTKGRVWTLSLVVSDGAAKDALRAHNDYFDSQASSHFQTARGNDLNEALPGAVSALCAAMAKIEPPRGGGGVNVDDIRANVQILFDKMEVKPAETVVEGRQGSLPSRFPTARYTIDGNPVTDFHVTAFVQNGRQLARTATDSRGELPLKNIKVPFVHNGSMLTVSPDARVYMKSDEFIRYKDLGVRFTKGQELAFIYKVPTLTYTLEYKVSVKDKSDKTLTIPPDFNADAHVRKYLKDFCGLVPASSGKAADLAVRITAEISKVSHDDTEEDGVIMSASADFRGGGIERNGRKVFEKRYGYGTDIQKGAYFWEASGAIRELIAATLSKD
jgi:hypothetical protein